MHAFEVLGVSPWATDGEIAAAYRRRARELHLDAHPHLSPEERRSYEAAMARLNLAYRAIRSTDGRTALRASLLRSGALPAATPSPQAVPVVDVTPEPPAPAPASTNAADPVVPDASQPRLVTGPRLAFLVAVVAVVMGVGFVDGAGRDRDLGHSTPAVGGCVAWVGGYAPTACSAEHSGMIVARTSSPAECATGNSFVTSPAQTYCIDVTR